MYNLQLSPEQLEIRDTVRDFVTEEVKPRALRPERLESRTRPLLFDVLDKASQLGLRTLALSEDAGGAGRPRNWRWETPMSAPCWRAPRRSPTSCSTG